MKYSEFKKKAFPENKREYDNSLTIVSRTYRPVGLVLGFICVRIGLSANSISLFRVLIVLLCFYLLTLTGNQYLCLRITAVCLLLLVKILDYTDGAVARFLDSTSELGAKFDEISELVVRAGMILVLFGYYSNIAFMIPYAVFMAWVINKFGKPLKEKGRESNYSLNKKKFFNLFLETSKEEHEAQTDSILFLLLNLYSKLFKSDFMSFILLPLLLVLLNNDKNKELLALVSLVIMGVYTTVMVLRFIGGVREYSRGSIGQQKD